MHTCLWHDLLQNVAQYCLPVNIGVICCCIHAHEAPLHLPNTCTTRCPQAVELGKPWVLDPVGCGATSYRTAACLALLKCHPAVVRGNASEIMALAGAAGGALSIVVAFCLLFMSANSSILTIWAVVHVKASGPLCSHHTQASRYMCTQNVAQHKPVVSVLAMQAIPKALTAQRPRMTHWNLPSGLRTSTNVWWQFQALQTW